MNEVCNACALNRIMAVFYIYQFYSGSVIAPSVLFWQCSICTSTVGAVFYCHQFYPQSCVPAVFLPPSVLFRQCYSSICCVSGSVIHPSVVFRQCFSSICCVTGSVLP